MFRTVAAAPEETTRTNPIFTLPGVVIIGVLLVVLAFAVIRFNRGSPSSVLRPFSKPVMSDSISVPALRTQYWTFEIGPTMTNAHLVGSFHASGGFGNDIETIVGESGECENWINGHPAQLLYTSGKVTNRRIDVPIREAGDYCLAFSNRASLVSAKSVSGNVELPYLTSVERVSTFRGE
jgi:hypothetical protein